MRALWMIDAWGAHAVPHLSWAVTRLGLLPMVLLATCRFRTSSIDGCLFILVNPVVSSHGEECLGRTQKVVEFQRR